MTVYWWAAVEVAKLVFVFLKTRVPHVDSTLKNDQPPEHAHVHMKNRCIAEHDVFISFSKVTLHGKKVLVGAVDSLPRSYLEGRKVPPLRRISYHQQPLIFFSTHPSFSVWAFVKNEISNPLALFLGRSFSKDVTLDRVF